MNFIKNKTYLKNKNTWVLTVKKKINTTMYI